MCINPYTTRNFMYVYIYIMLCPCVKIESFGRALVAFVTQISQISHKLDKLSHISRSIHKNRHRFSLDKNFDMNSFTE